MMRIENGSSRQERREPWSRLKESAAALALVWAAGCAHIEAGAQGAAAPPRGPIGVYAVEAAGEPERVQVGEEYNVLLRPDIRIMEGGRVRSLADYEAGKSKADLTYCWFVFQDAGYAQDGAPVLFLLNPRYSEYGQPRYIGALLDFGPDQYGRPVQAVVPVSPERTEPDLPENVLWSFGKAPERREDALFFVHPGTVVPVMDGMLASKLGEYCKETAFPQYQVVEYGPTAASFAIYLSRRVEE